MPIIGISGKINSGKDYSGAILQYLTSEYNRFYTFEEWYDRVTNYNSSPNSTYEIRKFADKLKDIVCIFLGCTRKQLEDRNFKNKPLGPDWVIWFGRNYKLTGENNPRGQVTSIFSTKMEVEQELYTYGNKIQVTDIVREELTPRTLLQLMGTESGRKIIHPDIWVNSLMSEYKGIEQPRKAALDLPEEKELVYPSWIITDVRFPNEAVAIKKKGGKVIRIDRPYTTTEGGGNPATFNKEQFHPSETALDNYMDFDNVIINDGSTQDLIEQLKPIILHG